MAAKMSSPPEEDVTIPDPLTLAPPSHSVAAAEVEGGSKAATSTGLDLKAIDVPQASPPPAQSWTEMPFAGGFPPCSPERMKTFTIDIPLEAPPPPAAAAIGGGPGDRLLDLDSPAAVIISVPDEEILGTEEMAGAGGDAEDPGRVLTVSDQYLWQKFGAALKNKVDMSKLRKLIFRVVSSDISDIFLVGNFKGNRDSWETSPHKKCNIFCRIG